MLEVFRGCQRGTGVRDVRGVLEGWQEVQVLRGQKGIGGIRRQLGVPRKFWECLGH